MSYSVPKSNDSIGVRSHHGGEMSRRGGEMLNIRSFDSLNDASHRKLDAIRSITQINFDMERYNKIKILYKKLSYISDYKVKNDIDIYSTLILFVIGIYNINGYSSNLNSESKFYGLRAVSIKGISDVISISRETVRRRLNDLEEAGLISRLDGNFIIRDWGVWNEIFTFLSEWTSSNAK